MKLWQKVFVPALFVGVVAAGAPQSALAQAAIKIDGSSTVFPVSEAFAEEFQISKRGKDPHYGRHRRARAAASSGSARARRTCQNASRPISTEEMEACEKAGIEYIELPVAYDGAAVVISPNNTWPRACDDRRRPEEDVGAGRPGHASHLEPSPLRPGRRRR